MAGEHLRPNLPAPAPDPEPSALGAVAGVVEWINGPLAKAAITVALCLGLLVLVHAILRRMADRWKSRTEGGLSRGDQVAMTVILTLATAFALIAFAMSAAALHDSAVWLEDTPIPVNGGDLRFMFPLVLDGLIVLFLALDLWTEWRGIRHPYYRWVAYSLSALTLYLNVRHGGGGSLLGHAAPPLGVIVISEGLAIWIRSTAGLISTGRTADRVPMGHWLARPASAYRVWRLMVGWGVKSYSDAVGMDRERSLAYAMLRQQYGRDWRHQTPTHVRWMLDNGTDLGVAYELTRAMTRGRVAMTAEEVQELPVVSSDMSESPAPLRSPSPPAESGHDDPQGDTPDTDAAIGDTAQVTADVAPESDTTPEVEATPDTPAIEAPAVPRVAPTEPVALSDKADRDRKVIEWLREDPDMSGAEIGRRLETTSKTGQRLKARLGPVAAMASATPDSDTQEVPAFRVKEWKAAH